MQSHQTGLEIAIIGISGRFPGSKSIDDFWENLTKGVELTSVFSDSQPKDVDTESQGSDKRNVKVGAVLDNVELFDASFFGFNPREAETMDPQHRLFLECAWEALEDAGYDTEIEARPIGVYAGVGMGTYLLYNLSPNQELIKSRGFLPTLVGVDKDYLPTRVSYKLNLKGPSVSIGTACSSSLVAVHLACQSLLSGECDMALAAGVSVKVPQNEVTLSPSEIVSPDGHCRAFDARANGTIGGNGIGVVVLKRLEDAITDRDHIYAVIKGSAINNDGAVKVGYTAPSEEGQARAIKAAQIMAEVEPETITYLETHGTGTALGDPIEIAAMTQAFRAGTDQKGYCAIGSVKTNVGHLDATAGIAGLIKTVLALKRKLLPPTLNFETPNPEIDFANSPFYVNTELSEWKANGIPRRAGVSSFGFGGTNAHVILEEAPVMEASSPSRSRQLLLLSAKTSSALETATTHLVNHLKHHPDLNLADVTYTLQVGRQAFNYRQMVIVKDVEDTIKALSDPQRFTHQEFRDRPVVFMFTGQGAQYVNMAREIYQSEAIFRQVCDRCCELIKPQLGLDLRQLLYPTEAKAEQAAQQLQQTAITQPALFVVEYALAKLWMSWGIRPEAMIGHSIGEYVAACLAGVFSLEDALSLVVTRGRLMQQQPGGAMLAVGLLLDDVQHLLSEIGEKLSIAANNSPGSSVVSGTLEAIERLEGQLVHKDVSVRRLHTSHAFHSEMMDAILEPFTLAVKAVDLNPPQMPLISNLTGTWMTATDATDPQYWVQHLRQTVRFAEGIAKLLQDSERIFLEVGPGQTLSTLTKQQANQRVILSSLRHPKDQQSDLTFLLNTLGRFWLAGARVDWLGFYAHEQRDRLSLPTYPFEGQRYWIEPPQATEEPQLPTPSELWTLVEAGQRQAARISESDQQTYLDQRGLDGLCTAYMNLALRNLGAFSNSGEQYSLEALSEQCRVIPRYRPLFSRWLQGLTEQGHLQQDQGLFTNLAPCATETVQAHLEAVTRWASPKVALVQRCGENLAAVLMGKTDPLEFFQGFLYDFDQADTNLEAPWHHHYSAIIQAILGQAVRSLSPLANLRVLEIAGGIDYVTDELLPVLPGSQTSYTFADVSGSFLNVAKKRFSQYPWVECRSLDINQPATEQGYVKGSFDVIVAVKSLHIAKNIEAILQNVHSLLAPGGLLLLWEKTQQTLDLDITWALLMNPLKEERSLDNLYLSKDQWEEALRASGFVQVAAFPETSLGQHVLVAQASWSAVPSTPLAFTSFRQKDLHQTPLSSGKKPDIADWFYIPSWKRCMPPQPFQLGAQTTQLGYWLVFVDQGNLAGQILKQLELEGQDVVTVRVGEQFSSSNHPKSQRVYTINPQQPNDYNALLKELIALDLTPKTIVHLWSLTSQDQPVSGLDVDPAQEKGFYSLLFLAQALGKQHVTSELQITVISNNLQSVTGQETLSPEKATLLGPVKVIPQEYPNIHCRSIDVALPEAGSWQEERLVDCLLSESSANVSDQVIAYRGLHRWVPDFEPVRLDNAFSATPRLRQGGVYLITGGLGAIGLNFASHLAKTLRAKLILTGRSSFPAKDEWQGWLINHDQDDAISRKIHTLKELEALGAEIFVAMADVADFDAMQPVIAQAQERFGQINGVFHAAGVLGDGAIALKTREDVEIVLAPKVRGALVLDAILKDVELDFMVLCSSRASIRPVFGQVSYASANNFLDAFAHYKSSKDGTFAVSVNLVNAWLGGGITVEAAKKLALTRNYTQSQVPAAPMREAQVDLLEDGYLPAEGIEVFSRILGSTLPQVVVSTTDLKAVVNQNRVEKALDQVHLHLPTQPTHPRPELNNAYVTPRNETEKMLADIWQTVLGIKQVGIHDNFFELGGDSLLTVQIRSKLQETFNQDFLTTDLFQYPTISALADYINREQVEQPAFQQAHDRARRQQNAMEAELQLIKQRRKRG